MTTDIVVVEQKICPSCGEKVKKVWVDGFGFERCEYCPTDDIEDIMFGTDCSVCLN